jgi:hypothetical protein
MHKRLPTVSIPKRALVVALPGIPRVPLRGSRGYGATTSNANLALTGRESLGNLRSDIRSH